MGYPKAQPATTSQDQGFATMAFQLLNAADCSSVSGFPTFLLMPISNGHQCGSRNADARSVCTGQAQPTLSKT